MGPLRGRGRGWAGERREREWEGEGGKREREGPQVTVEPGPLRALLRYWWVKPNERQISEEPERILRIGTSQFDDHTE